MKKQILNLSFVGIIGALFLTHADAAPTVKKLGTANNVVRTTSAGSAVKSEGSNLSRVSSARMNTAKPIKTTVSPVVKTTTADVAVSDTSEARLSLGKYLHGANVSKTNPSGNTAGVASNDFIELKERVTKTETDIETATQDFKDHIEDADIHVSLDDKDKWNAKQDALTPAEDGTIVIEDGVIRSVVLLPVGKGKTPSAPMWIE